MDAIEILLGKDQLIKINSRLVMNNTKIYNQGFYEIILEYFINLYLKFFIKIDVLQ
jgi:hypothetical protein